MENIAVYWNRHLRVWSLRHKGRVIDHRATLTLADATFKVSQASRLRVILTGKRTVHALVVGTVTEGQSQGGVRVRYNPFRGPSFTTEDGSPVTSSPLVSFGADGAVHAVL